MSDESALDAVLVAAVRRGSREAAGRLAERYLGGCRAVALAIVGEVSGAEDVAQEAFVHAIDRIDDCRDPERFGSWLRQIVRRRARNHLRHQGVRRTIGLHPDAAVYTGDAPDDAAERADLRSRLLAALGQLPEERREVVLLHDLEGWTHKDIAERMNLPPGTVRSHLHYARRRLRELLGGITGGDR